MFIYLQMIEDEPDRVKFELLYVKYQQLMHYVANQVLHNSEDAEDAVHNAFIAIAKNISKISGVDCPKTRSYIVVITENKAIDMLRSRQRVQTMEYNDALGGMEIPMDEDDRLACAISRLPARYRELLLLKYDSGYNTRELAKLLDMTEENVRMTLFRARKALKKQLEEGEE